MYRDKAFRERNLAEVLEDIQVAGAHAPGLEKVFVADGDPLIQGMERWKPILRALRVAFPRLRSVSCYSTAANVLDKTPDELLELREAGLGLLYIGPESGDEVTLKRIVKGGDFADHVKAARMAHDAGMKISSIMLLGSGGVARTEEHAMESARLITEMDPDYLAALTLTVIPGTPLQRMRDKGKFELPPVPALLRELRTMVADSRPTNALFRTNHASSYLPLAGRLPEDRERIVALIDQALDGKVPLRPEYMRGL